MTRKCYAYERIGVMTNETPTHLVSVSMEAKLLKQPRARAMQASVSLNSVLS